MSEGKPKHDSAPVTDRGRRTASALRQSARRVFSERGYAAARVEDVVADAGVSHGTFYTYYDNKGAVLDALVDETDAALREVVDQPWEGADAPETVGTVIRRFMDTFIEYSDVVGAWMEASAYEAHFRERLREVRSGYTNRVAEQLAPALAHTDHDPMVVAAALVALVEGYATQGLEQSDGEAREVAVRTLTEIWIGGVRELVSN